MSKIEPQDIANFQLLAGLSSEQCIPFSERIKEMHFPTGQVVFQEGDPGDKIYFLLSGQVEISQALTLPMAKSASYDSRAKSITRLSSEDFPVFGEIALFSGEDVRTATVTAVAECHMGLLSSADFSSILESEHEIGFKVMSNLVRILSVRLSTANLNVLKLTTALSLILEK